ncbi:MAG TPA: hypothetical protein VIM70_11105 [Clostridium sp.]|uniref:hypothetical protein n=1 Tax=Clostridium sp. TaxID=1506 RepID=UPI002F93E4B5
MNKSDLQKASKSNNQPDDNEGVSGASNIIMTNMYNMPEMASGPGDATLEEKSRLNERSLVNNKNTEK